MSLRCPDAQIALERIKGINLPDVPGLYIFKDQDGNPLYVGKARSIGRRIHEHFIDHKSSFCSILSKVFFVDCIVLGEQIEESERLLIRFLNPQGNREYIPLPQGNRTYFNSDFIPKQAPQCVRDYITKSCGIA